MEYTRELLFTDHPERALGWLIYSSCKWKWNFELKITSVLYKRQDSSWRIQYHSAYIHEIPYFYSRKQTTARESKQSRLLISWCSSFMYRCTLRVRSVKAIPSWPNCMHNNNILKLWPGACTTFSTSTPFISCTGEMMDKFSWFMR